MPNYVKYDSNHPFDWRVDDRDNITSLALIIDFRAAFDSTRFISVTITDHIIDDRTNIVFDLIDLQYSSMFNAFCHALIEDSRSFAPDIDGVKHIQRIYDKWRQLFTGPRHLEIREIRGLIGELYFLKNHLFEKYGKTASLQAWMNLKFGKQDFIVDDTWYEVKATNVDSQTVKISSLDQLDRNSNGILAIVFLIKSSPVSSTSLTLNTLFREVRGSFESDLDRELFVQIMLSIGYSDQPSYDEFAFEVASLRMFSVEEGFPRLRRSTLDVPGLSDAEYEILIQYISKFEVV